MLQHIEPRTARRNRGHNRRRALRIVVELSRPVLRILQQARLHKPQRAGQVIAEAPAGIAVGRKQDADLVIAKSVSVKLFHVVQSVVQQELPDILVPQRKREPPGAAVLIGKVQAVVVIAHVRHAIKVVQASIVQRTVHGKAAGMVVHHIERHRDSIHMAEVDQRLQLRVARLNILKLQRTQTLRLQQAVDRRQVPRQRRCVRHNVGKVRGEIVRSVVSHGRVGLHFIDGQRLQNVDPQRHQVRNLPDNVEEGRTHTGRLNRIGPDVNLVHDHVCEVRRNKAGVVPRIRRGRTDIAASVGKRRIRRQPPRIRIALVSARTRPGDIEAVQVSIRRVRKKAGPVAAIILRQEQVVCLCVAGLATEDAVQVDRCGPRGPHAKRRSSGNQRGSHGCVGRDVLLGNHAILRTGSIGTEICGNDAEDSTHRTARPRRNANFTDFPGDEAPPLPNHLLQRLTRRLQNRVHLSLPVRRAHKRGLKLAGRQPDAALDQRLMKARKGGSV